MRYGSKSDKTLFKSDQTKGSGGPSQFDAKQWKRILCSNSFKTEAKENLHFRNKLGSKEFGANTVRL